MDEARIDQAKARIEDALARIERAAARPAVAADGGTDTDRALRSKVAKALGDLDDLIAELER